MPTLFEITNNIAAKQKQQSNPLKKNNSGSLLEITSKIKPPTTIEQIRNKVSPSTITGLQDISISKDKQSVSPLKQSFNMAVEDTFETGKRVGKWLLDFSRAVAQSGPRAMASSALPIAGSFFGDDKPTFTPKTKLEKAVFGSEPIKGMFQYYTEKQSAVNKVTGGNPVLSGASTVATPFAVAGLMLSDLTPIAGLEENTIKNISKNIAKSTEEGAIVKSLSRIFKTKTDNILKPIATELVDINDEKVINNFLSGLVKDSKKSGGIEKLLSTADNVPTTKIEISDLNNIKTGQATTINSHAGVGDNALDSGFRTTDIDIANSYALDRGGRVEQFSDKINNPFVAKNQNEILQNMADAGDEEAKKILDEYHNFVKENKGTSNQDSIVRKIDNYIKDKLSIRGYDAVIYPEQKEYQLFNIKNSNKLGSIYEDVSNVAKKIVYDTPQQVEKKVVSQVFRGDKLNLAETQLTEIGNRLKALGLDTRGVKTFSDMEDAAQNLGVDVVSLLKDTSKNRITSDEVVALRNLIKNQSDFIVQAQKDISSGALKTEKVVELQQKIKIAESQIDTALTKVVKGGTEAGRAVAAYRILANKTMDPVFWLEKAKKITNNDVLKPEIHDAIIDLIGKKDTIGLVQLISSLRNPSFTEKAITLWKANLLSSPTTHFANIAGNTSMRALLDASNVLSTGLDVLASIFTKKRTQVLSPSLISARAKGLARGIKDAKQYMRTGLYADDFVKKWDIPRMVRFKNKILDGYTQAIFRSLGAEDAVFRGMAMQESLEKQAILTVKKEGLRGADAINRTRQLLVEPTNEMIAEAIDAAEYATFQSKNVLNDLIAGAKHRVKGRPLAEAAVEFVAPFSKTPTNVAARIADFSPLGFIKALVNVARPSTRSQKALVEDLSRAITGTGIIGFGAYLAQKGLMTGNLPTDKQERDDFFASGKQANSIYLFGQWRQLNRVSPFGNLLSLGAEFEKQSKEKSGLDLAASTAAGGLKALSEQTFLKGASSALGAINDPERNASKYIEQSVASIVPTGVYKIAKTLDPTLRDPDGIWQTIQNKLPLISDELPAKRDVFGHAVKVSGGKASIIDPFSSKAPTDYPALKEANRIGVNIGIPNQVLSGTKLTNKEFSLYQKIQGNVLEDTMNNIISSDFYKQANDKNKKEILDKTISMVRDKVNSIIYPQLMATRYNLPENTNPQLLSEVLRILNKNEIFKKMDQEKQEGFIKEMLTKNPVNVLSGQ